MHKPHRPQPHRQLLIAATCSALSLLGLTSCTSLITAPLKAGMQAGRITGDVIEGGFNAARSLAGQRN